MNIGYTIRQIRKENHLSQEQLSNKIGVKRSMISMWKNNKRTPNILSLASVLRLSNTDIKTIKKAANIVLESGEDKDLEQFYMPRTKTVIEVLKKYRKNDNNYEKQEIM